MKTMLKKSALFLLVVIMIFGAVPLGLFLIKTQAADITYKNGDLIEFGSYPQSEVTDVTLLSELSGLSKTWISYGYYSGDGSVGSMVQSDYMKYADVTYNGNKYRAVTFSSFRPGNTYGDSTSFVYQDDNGYNTPNNVYWFKYDSLKWRVLDFDTGLIICEKLIDAQPYNNTLFKQKYGEYYKDSTYTSYANNYATSSIRDWLNSDFYNTAFTSSQKSTINTTYLNNKAYSTSYSQYDSIFTNDKVFLLSYSEATNPNYFISDTARQANGSDYAKCQGLRVDPVGKMSEWTLRTAGSDSDDVCYVGMGGSLSTGYYASSANYIFCGIRPSLTINLKDIIPNTNNYSLGEETYSFKNFGDSHSNGHCFGMSMTSSGYYLGKLNVLNTGISDSSKLHTLSKTSTVTDPICYYQKMQADASLNATVAGGTYYYNNSFNISSDWNEVVNYVKNHEYDNKGMLQIGFRKQNEGGHAVNFLRYEEINGQARIYAYDNNFPDIETYFYKGTDEKIYQSPKSTFSGSIDCIALRSVDRYFKSTLNYDLSRYIYALINRIRIVDSSVYSLDENTESGERVVFKAKDNAQKITIIPLEDNAEFTYLDKTYHFGKIDEDTVATLTLSSGENTPQDSQFEIKNAPLHITGITVKKTPAKTEYVYKQDELDLSGIELLVTYSDGTTETVTDTSKMTVSGFVANRRGTQTLTVNYEGLQADFNVKVKYTWWQWILVIVLFGWIWY